MQITKMAQFAEGKIHALSRITSIIAIGVLVAMMLFTVLDVFLRAFLNNPIPGDVELIEMAMVFVGFLGLAWCAMRGMHIRVDLIVSFMPTRTQGIIDSFCYLAGLGICALMAWQSVLEGIANWEMTNLSPTLRIPVFPFYWVIAVGYAILSLAILVLLARSLTQAVKG